jgi:hypothetical protein
MSDPEQVFVTVALQYRAGGLPPAGFFCLWDRELTFVASKWVQLVYPIPFLGMLLPHDPRPTGPEDKRTRVRVNYSDITQVTPHKQNVVVHTASGAEHRFGGAGFNQAFRFKPVAQEIAKALQTAGYQTTLTDSVLTVDPGDDVI